MPLRRFGRRSARIAVLVGILGLWATAFPAAAAADVTPPPTPSGVIAAQSGPGRVTVTWDSVVDNASGVWQYQIWRNGNWYDWVLAPTTTYIDTQPVPGGYYQLRAIDNADNRSGWSAPAYPTSDVTPPPTPSGVVATGGGGGPAQVVFDAEANNLGGISSRVNASTPTAAAKNGNRGLRLSATNAPAYARWDTDVVPQNHAYASARFWVRVQSRAPGQSVDLFTIANTQSSKNFDFFVSALTGHFQWDLFGPNADESSFPVTFGRWYLIDAQVEYAGGTHSAQVRIDGVYQGAITSPGPNSLVRTMSTGAYTAKTHTQHYDDIALQVGDQPLGWLAPGPGGGDVTVTWNPVVDNASGLWQYQIWRNGNWYDWVLAPTTTYIDTQPVPGGYYQLRAIDNADNRSGWSAPAFP